MIHQSKTACYARDRKKALNTLGDDYPCYCHPEVMDALLYGLNDADEKVRAEAADEIGDQLSKYCCCCSDKVLQALTKALGDCDRKVRHQVTEALEACGYEVIDGNCCQQLAGNCCGQSSSPPQSGPTPAPEHLQPAPPPPPPSGANTKIPSRIRPTNARKLKPFNKQLSALFEFD